MAEQSTIKYGVDLGTTNSALAILDGNTVKLVSNAAQQKTTPSAVYIRGKIGANLDVVVGEEAKLAIMQQQVVFTEFKRELGKDPKKIYRSPKAPDDKFTAEDLSGFVLREIRNMVALHGDLPPASAIVVTIPAAFEDPQKDETIAAAYAAGFAHVELVPEPEAAALAYGRSADTSKNPIWLAYDLGGGTFDAALLQGEDGVFTVIDHLGDRNIGGKDLDVAIMNELVIPKLPEAARSVFADPEAPEWNALKGLVEKAKIELSTRDQAAIYFDAFNDISKLDPVELNRSEVDALQVQVFGPTLEICARLLAKNNLEADHIEKIILIGGPTQSSFLRTMIEHGAIDAKNQVHYKGLGVETDASIDPMTAVASGAAIIAAGRRYEHSDEVSDANPQAVRVTVEAPARSLEEDELVAGALTGADDFTNWTLRIIREASGSMGAWESDTIPLSAAGKFASNVILNDGLNTFLVNVLDPDRNLVVGEYRFEILKDVGIGDRTLERGIGVADHEGNTVWIFEKGHPLPEGSDRSNALLELSTTVALQRGVSGAAVQVPVVAGEYAKAALNRQIGLFTAEATDVPVDIPESALVRVEASLDVSGRYDADAYLEDFDDYKLKHTKKG
ncbi:MAG: Hsp70 family protein, partial [Pseudomonadota bacterium]